jgi:hypothetical protein
MKDKDDGISVKTRKLRLRAFDKCFIGTLGNNVSCERNGAEKVSFVELQ